MSIEDYLESLIEQLLERRRREHAFDFDALEVGWIDL